MRRLVILLSALFAFASAGAGTPQTDRTDILGVWRGIEGALPAVTLTITDEGGTLAGAILFYLIRREAGKDPTSSPGVPEPLLHPKIDGNTLNFEVSHRRAHPPRTLSDPPVSFHLKLSGPNRGELTRGEDSNKLDMIRDN